MRVAKLALAAWLALFLLSCATTKEEDRQKAQAHYKIGVSHLNSGNIQPAYVEFQMALSLDRENKEIHNALGYVYQQLSDLKAAEEHYQTAVRIDPSYSDAHNNLCYLYYQLRQWDKAIASCGKALQNPIYATPEKAYYNMARAYYRKGSYDEAIKAYSNALKRFPGLYLAHYGLALSYNAKGEYGTAAEAMAEGLKLDPAIKGDRGKAEEVFLKRKARGEETEDIGDYLEILKY